MEILRKETLEQIPRCKEEQRILEAQGYSEGLESAKLAIKYEVFLNSIYCLCENISQVTRYLFRPNANLPIGFNKQKVFFLKHSIIDAAYSATLKETFWYDEVHGMRTEATHYLSGFVVNPSVTGFGYFNIPKSEKADASQKIEVDDIEGHVNQLFANVIAFVLLWKYNAKVS